jgi:hypothetical protein
MSWERRLLAAAIGAWAVVTLLGIATGPPLGHDEAAFSVLARGGSAATWLYRSSGVIALAKLGVALGGSEWAIRIASALTGFGVVAGVFAVGRAAFPDDGGRTGAWAAAVIAGAHPMVLRSAELIGDLPATGCMLAGIALLAGELARQDGPRWRLVAAAPAFAGAFYLRYGSAPVIAIAGGAALVLWWRQILRRPAPVFATTAAFTALLVPHCVQSLRATGSLFGILEVSSQMPRRAYVGEGLVTYLTSNPLMFYGALVAPLMIAGLGALVRPPGARRSVWFLGAIAVGQIAAIGLQSHAQPRYIFVATCLLVLLGVAFVRRALPPRPRLALALVVLSWLGCAIAVVPYNVHLARLRAPLMTAANTIRADAQGQRCIVVARVVTQLAWYTGCDVMLLRDPTRLDPLPDGVRAYLASVPHGTTGPDVAAATLHRTASPIATHEELSQVWQLR